MHSLGELESKSMSCREVASMLLLAFMLVLVELLALLFSPSIDSNGYYAFGERGSTDVISVLYYILLMFGFTVFILIAIKKDAQIIVRLAILLTVFATFYYIFSALLSPYFHPIVGIFPALLLTFLLHIYPEWYVLDILGVVLGATAASIFGVSLSPLPIILLLIALAFYDIIAVYRTGHMIILAEEVVKMRIPVLLVSPVKKGFSLIEKQELKEGKRDAYYMGLGDAVMPAMLISSSATFLAGPVFMMGLNLPALLAVIASLGAFFILMYMVHKGKPHAGLPLLNGFTIAGYLVGCLLIGVPPF